MRSLHVREQGKLIPMGLAERVAAAPVVMTLNVTTAHRNATNIGAQLCVTVTRTTL